MKAYTDLEQSKKLAEILPIESADMGWDVFVDNSARCLPINDWDLDKDGSNGAKFIPCWSLAALIELMCECRMERTPLDQSGVFTHSFVDDYFNIRTYEEYDIIDAAVEMILKLHEQNLL